MNRWVRTIAIDPGGESQPGLRQILKQGKDIVYLMADQYFVVSPGQESPPHLVALRLLNQTVHLDMTAVRSAKRLGAQALTAIPVKSGHRQRVLLEPMEWASAGTGTADVARPLQIYLARLEERLLE